MLGFLRSSLRSILFGVILLAGLGAATQPASAACVCVGAVTQLIGSGQNGSSVCDCVANKIVGKTTTFPWKLPGFTGNMPKSGQLTSLIDYYENIFWPRWIAMEQKMAQGDAQTNAANTHTSIQLLDVQAQHTYQRDSDVFKADTVVRNMGRTDSGCVDPTMVTAVYGGGIVADIETHNLLATAIEKRDGSSKFADYSKGLVNFYNRMIDARKDALCNPEGNDGADAEWCKAPKNGPVMNADVNPAVQYVSRTLSSNKEDKHFHEYAERMADNIFSFYFTPIRKNQLTSRSNQINEVLFDRLKFNTQVSNLELVFSRDIALKKPLKNVDPKIKEAYLQQLKLLGIETGSGGQKSPVGSLFTDVNNNDMSINAIEETYFKGKNLDPSEMIRVAGQSALNLENIALYQTFKVMNSIVLLYDIRQEQRLTNKLLATIGSLLAADRHQAIEAKIQAVSTN